MSGDTRSRNGQPAPTSDERQLPAHLVERVRQAVRLVGLPLAAETGGVGVCLEREGPGEGPVDHVVIRWRTSAELWATAEDERPDGPAEKLRNTTLTAMEDALSELLAAGGLVVAKHPFTRSLAVWGIEGPPPVE
ncbi:hypothetical protein FH609_028695 [Streptomyces sp. 3MP-14]|uniref:Uncharacterized protein n=1 Tax=Streptomyces mimosae TaxID=2586635 RepID=A0A5N5ZX04_9ACTN|nr:MULTISPECIES: hypothetical protein [Streptomyces]KAB8159568.1 hypothetical protein FH607_028175 [Streptomyces mimosae]KAB8172846.1 hypothetical protein FH609_028695 [Streptomyces sp. 3MP-14]